MVHVDHMVGVEKGGGAKRATIYKKIIFPLFWFWFCVIKINIMDVTIGGGGKQFEQTDPIFPNVSNETLFHLFFILIICST